MPFLSVVYSPITLPLFLEILNIAPVKGSLFSESNFLIIIEASGLLKNSRVYVLPYSIDMVFD